ncbi:MAG: ATP-binding protein [Rickettsia endosymbiont of Pentastiridius leporinus]
MEVLRDNLLAKIKEEYSIHQVCGLIGPRQSGKTTLAKSYLNSIEIPIHFFDCENHLHLARLENPMLTFQELQGLVVIDEVQLRPDLFPVLRVIVDNNKESKFLVTGSASRDLLNQSSETLAGRIGYHQVTPFSFEEVKDWKLLWKRGGFPKSFLAASNKLSERWRDEYIKTFLERDILKLGFDVTPSIVNKLWRMLSFMQGQVLNIHHLSQSLGIDQRTVKRYLDILESTFMITLLRPWHNNSKKREVKSSKIYIRDSGLLHRLLGLSDEEIEFNPKLGASFEGFAIEEIIRHFNAYETSYFWATHSGAELDLLITNGIKKIGFEIKYTERPKITKSMNIAFNDLGLKHLYLIIPSNEKFKLSENITCVGIEQLSTII